jgi:DNA-binding transcriptional LysR family regulator
LASSQNAAWTFNAGAGEETITVKGRFAADGSAMCNEAVVLGLGIGIAPLWQIRGLVDQGRVELILSEYKPRPVPIYAVWSATPALPTRVRAYLEFVTSRLTADRL